MNEKITRIDSETAAKQSRTDWAKLRSLTDEQIDAAIADDPDTFAIRDRQNLGHDKASFRYEIYRDAFSNYRWRVKSADGVVVAVGAEAFVDREAVFHAIGELRDILLGARAAA